jgi:hypothetical protein
MLQPEHDVAGWTWSFRPLYSPAQDRTCKQRLAYVMDDGCMTSRGHAWSPTGSTTPSCSCGGASLCLLIMTWDSLPAVAGTACPQGPPALELQQCSSPQWHSLCTTVLVLQWGAMQQLLCCSTPAGGTGVQQVLYGYMWAGWTSSW